MFAFVKAMFLGLMAATLTLSLQPAEVRAADSNYFAGKTIKILRGGQPGGSGDMQARSLVPFLKKHIPGNPSFVIEAIPGAAGMAAVNQVYNNYKPDGLTIAAVGSGLATGAILGLPGVKYDIDKLIYLGSTESGDPYIFVGRKQSGYDTLAKLQAATGVRIGAQSVGHAVYVSGRIFAFMLGLKAPRMVVGFGGRELDIALDQGEIDVRSNSADTTLRRNAAELDKGEIIVYATLSIPKGNLHPHFSKVPDIDKLVKTERERRVISLFREFLYPRWPYVLPPGTPPAIVKTLREAMAKSFKDPAFPAAFKQYMGSDPTPITGEQVEASIKDIPRDAETIAFYKKFAEHGPVPQR